MHFAHRCAILTALIVGMMNSAANAAFMWGTPMPTPVVGGSLPADKPFAIAPGSNVLQ